MFKMKQAVLAALLASSLVVPALAITAVTASPANAAGAVETMPLWRLQVRVTTGDTTSAGTNGHPAFRFNSTSTGVRTLNPPSTTAFDKGRVDTYDLRLLDTPSQITMLRVGIAGSDDWCVKRVELLFNNRVAFASDTVPGGACATIKAGTYVEFSSAALRNNSAWVNYGNPPQLPSGISHGLASVMATSVTGSAMLSSPNVAGDRSIPLTVTRRNSTALAIAFGVIRYDPAGVDSPERVRVTYDVKLYVGADGRLHAKKTNASCCAHYSMSDTVVEYLNASLSRMSARPVPITFSVSTSATSWS